MCSVVFFFQAEDGIRDLVRSRGLGDVYKRQFLYNKEIVGDFERSFILYPLRIANLWNGFQIAETLSLIHI